MRLRATTVSAATAAIAILVLAVPAHAAEGQAPAAVGWWTRTPGAQPAPEGGFEVAAFGGEPVSVAALRFDAPSGATTATLTLVEDGGTVTPATALRVCTTTDPWQPANPGAYADAPSPDCANGADLARDEEAGEWTAEVGSLLGAGSLMVVPGEAAAGGSPLDPGFRVTFSAAGLAVVTAPAPGSSPAFAQPEGGGGTGGTGGGGGFQASPAPAPSPAATPTPGGGGSVDVGPAELPEAQTTVTTVAVDDDDAEAAGGGSQEAFGAPELAAGASAARTDGKPWARLLVLVPLSAVVGVGSVHGRKLLAARGMVET